MKAKLFMRNNTVTGGRFSSFHHFKSGSRFLALSISLIIGMAGCGSSSSSSPPPDGVGAPATTPVTITLDFDTLSGGNAKLKAFAPSFADAASVELEVLDPDNGEPLGEPLIDPNPMIITNINPPEPVVVTVNVRPGPIKIVVTVREAPSNQEALGAIIFKGDLTPTIVSGDAVSVTIPLQPVELVSIAVTPVEISIALGSSEQFMAMGTFSDDSTRDLTGSVTWSTAQPTVGFSTLSVPGLATGVSLGNAAITATDIESGITGTITLVVTDQTAPVVTAPAPITVAALDATGTPRTNAAITAFLNAASAIDNVDGPIPTISNNAPLTLFPLGTTAVVFTAVDAAGNPGSATSTVTVTDQVAPVVTAPAPITVGAVDGTGTPKTNAGLTAFLNAASATDDIDGPITAVNNNAPPTLFPLGVTTVVFTAVDAAGNPGSATSTVTVTDQVAPVVTVPTPITVGSVDGTGTPRTNAEITAFLNTVSATDNVDGPILKVSNNAPLTLILGTTTVTFSVTDAAGNPGSATSTVTVADQTAPVVNAPAPITVAAVDGNGTPRINTEITIFLNAASATDSVDGSIPTVSNNAPLALFPLGTTTVTFSVTDAAGNPGSATSTVTVTDQTAPVVNAPAPITVAAVDGTGTPKTNAEITVFLNAASATDDIDGPITVISNNAPVTFPLGETTVTFSVTDAAGNPGSATSTVTVTDQTAPVVNAPAPITVAAVNTTGMPRTNAAVTAFLNAASATDNVDGPIITINNNAPPTLFPLGTTTVVFTAVDAAGNPGTATSTVNVTDQVAPVVTAPAPITVAAVDGTGTPKTNAEITVFLNAASATDDIDGPIPTTGNNAPATFALGETTVTFSVTDAAGNPGSETSTVTVTDQTAPVVNAPTPITVAAVDGSGTPKTNAVITAFLNAASATDDIDGPITAIGNNAPLTLFPLGETTVTFSVTDAAGNPGSATSTVTVTDQTAPVISLLGLSPVDVSVGSIYVDAGATAFDLVDGNITLSIATLNPVNTAIPAPYFVTYNVSDAAGNPAAQVSRTVVVKPFHALTVEKSGTGSGTVTSSPATVSVVPLQVKSGCMDRRSPGPLCWR